MKGIYDTEKSRRRILVTGSARLDHCRKGGDSLVGRYRYFRLHPFSRRELAGAPSRSDVESFLKFGGFPEPLFAQSEVERRIWERERLSRVVREDLRDLQTHLGQRHDETGRVTVLPFAQLCEELGLP